MRKSRSMVLGRDLWWWDHFEKWVWVGAREVHVPQRSMGEGRMAAEAAERESWVVRVKGLRDSSLEVVV